MLMKLTPGRQLAVVIRAAHVSSVLKMKFFFKIIKKDLF